MHLSAEARFWLAVTKGDDCWLWTRSVNNMGYGMIYVDGKLRTAHRVAWTFTYGPIPDKAFVLHRCDNPRCVRPAHLFLGNQIDNMGDCSKKGRARSGSAKLTPDDVRTIRARYAAGEGISALARAYGMWPMPIHSLVHGKTWKHVK